ERLRSAYIDLNDLSSDADSQKEDVEFNPERMVFVEERLNLIYTLQQKHHLNSVAELIALQEKYTAQLQEIDSYDNQIEALQQQVDATFKELMQQASVLSEQRKIASLG